MVFAKLKEKIDSLDTASVSMERKAVLQPLISFIQSKVDTTTSVNLNFVCTHNSRRSHLSQIWAQTIGTYFGAANLFCYSAGTETTALFPMVVETLANSGFKIEKLSESNNPIYSIKYGENYHPIIGFSKTLNSEFNPENGFAAIMTCSSADEGCPFIAGAEKRIPITYEDPKISDGTIHQLETYEERSVQIATEMKYVFSKIRM
ncbi:arsenate-mycothiol transferase ArsC [Winogradskyella alexanderae]|uniref:Protein-tyrosine-phosphatase n=1 Tax=Winogradskyella alexanderae TaxID=2877123 RepID=A0ABS7XPC9_9FLAO|nr:protein-tyrosine-phosphatase [Winogradskyella alexanderae]MCA0131870.1 protein-tyrosine-phosphatase [Winogradskyella alexanderae]